ncbi:GxxExxY protein [uncultured Lacinutrix sp.]|uniref:GxxExxY protein n=1 Tax=uncultured Lacinutrix sp. TaxID=574032 RepID=UPI00260D78E7|nr:GxxExxY protein [uncultured Lacinutrix sp.]
MSELLYNEDTYKIIGLCMQVHKELGKGFSEVVYGDALEIELTDNNVNFSRETTFNISYKGNILPHKYKADFIIDHKIVLEIKAISTLTDSHIKQTLNYLAASKLKLGLLINFGEDSLKYRRVIL